MKFDPLLFKRVHDACLTLHKRPDSLSRPFKLSFALWSSWHKGSFDLLRSDEAFQPITGNQFDPHVVFPFRQRMVSGTASIIRWMEDETRCDILTTETIQLEVHNVSEREGYGCMLVQQDGRGKTLNTAQAGKNR